VIGYAFDGAVKFMNLFTRRHHLYDIAATSD